MNTRTITCIFLICSCIFNSQAAETHIVRHLSADDGLSHNSVRAILQDRNGFIWFGTGDGLNRYDGKRFRKFTPNDPNAQPENDFILSLCEDNNGTIWIGTGAGICRYDPKTDEEKVFAIDGINDRISIYQILKDSKGTIWATAGRYGFVKINPDSGKSELLSMNSSGEHFYGGALCFGPEDEMYILQGDGRVYVSHDELKTSTTLLPPEITPLKGTRLHEMQYAGGKLFAGVVIDPLTKTYDNPFMESNSHAIETKNGDVWIAGSDGIRICDTSLNVKESYTQDINNPLALQDRAVLYIYEDSDGGIWAGTFSGVYHFIPNRAQLEIIRPTDKQFKGIGKIVRDIIPDDGGGGVWIASEDKGVAFYSTETRSLSFPSIPIQSFNIQSLYKDGDNLWISSYSNIEPYAIYNIPTRKAVLAKCPQLYYKAFCRGDDGTMFFGTNKGVYKLENGDYVEVPPIRTSITSLTKDKEGNIWACSAHEGVLKIGPDGSTTLYKYEDGLPSNKISSAFQDSKGRLWIAGETGGFCRMENGRFIKYNSSTGFDFSMVCNIIEDKNGFLWITTGKGLLCLDPDTLQYFILTTKDGVPSNQYNLGALSIDTNGNIYAGSNSGIVVFNPEEVSSRTHASTVLISNLRSDDKSIASDAALYSGVPISLAHKYNSFTLTATNIESYVPNNTKIKWCIDSGAWRDTDNDIISIYNLGPGKHKIKIAAMSALNEQVISQRVLDINVKAPVLLSFPAIVCYFFLLVLMILLTRYGIQKQTSKKISREKIRMQEEQERKANKEKMEFIRNMAYELKAPVAMMREPLEHIQESVPTITGNTTKEDINTISINAERIDALANQLINYESIGNTSHPVNFTNQDVVGIVKHVLMRYEMAAKAKHITINLESPDSMIESVDGEILDKIISSLIDNILKFARTEAKIRIKKKADGHIVISLENDGNIVPKEMRKEIFRTLVKYSAGNSNQKGLGLGLSSASSLANLIGGTLEMDDDITTNRFILKLQHKSDTTLTDTENADKTVPAQHQTQLSITSANGKEQLIGSINTFIEDNIENTELKVEDIANAMYMSAATLQRKVHALLGMSVTAYLKLYRLKRAAYLLRNEEVPIAEIADRVGFGSQAYFSQCFKKLFGVTPKAYKNAKNKGTE